MDQSTEKTLTKNITISENIEMDTLDICDSYGKYRLVLNLKDSVGRTKEVTKDFEVTYTLPAPDKVQIAHSTGGTATMTWGFTYTPVSYTHLDVYKRQTFALPGKFAILETANDPGSIAASEGIEERAAAFAANMREKLMV